ncbi:MAG: DUF6658 family protein [Waterburya sp.]
MRNIIQSIKSIKIRQVLTVFLAGCLLVISTACSRGNVAQTPGKIGTELTKTASQPTPNTYDEYDANQSYKGGMNGYNDDRRYDARTTAKTKELIDTAKSRQTGGDIGEYVEDIGDRASNQFKQATRDIPRAIKGNTQEASEYVQDKSGNLKDNLGKLPGGAQEVFEGAKDNAKNAVKDAI